MRDQRAGTAARLVWLASPERERAAWSLSLEKIVTGRRRSGNRAVDTGVGVAVGRALATIDNPAIWGGLDFLSGDAMVAEWDVLANQIKLKDTADDVTPGVAAWRPEDVDGLPANIRIAKPLEGLVARTAAVGAGFEDEHVFFPARAELVSHHRPDSPPINSTPIHDPGSGEGWVAGLHSLTRVRPWVHAFCGGSAVKTDPLFSALLNFTGSAGDNTGWGGAHFASNEAVLSHEVFGFIRPSSKKHSVGGNIRQAAFDIDRGIFSDGTDQFSSPAEFVKRAWQPGSKGMFIKRVEWREDFNATHLAKCGVKPGMKKWQTWDDWRPYDPDWPPPTDPPDDPPTDDPPFEVEEPRSPTYVPYEPDPTTATPKEVESPSGYGHPVPGTPDVPNDTGVGTDDDRETRSDWGAVDYLRAEQEAFDERWIATVDFTEEEWNRVPLTSHTVMLPVYESANPVNDASDANTRWVPKKSRTEELIFDDFGGLLGRERTAMGPGSIMDLPSDAKAWVGFLRNKASWEATGYNAFGRIVAAGALTPGGGAEIAGRFGIGLRHPQSPYVASGWEMLLTYLGAGGSTTPDLVWQPKDEEGAAVTGAIFKIAGNFEVSGATTIHDKLTVVGLIDPTGLEFTQQASNPGSTIADTIYIKTATGHLTRAELDLENAANHHMARVAGSTFFSVQHAQDIFHSTGDISGGVIADAGSQTITVSAGTGAIRATDSDGAPLLWFDWGALSATAIATGVTKYIGVEYNSGSPQVVLRDTYNWNFHTDFPLGNVVNQGDVLHIENASQAVGNHASHMIQRLWGTLPVSRDKRVGGLILGETGTRNITVSAGRLWERLQSFDISALNTASSGSVAAHYRKVGDSGWNVAAITQWPNTQYDDNSGSLATMSNNKWANLWFYLELDDSVVMVYGQAQFNTEAGAENEAPPASTPPRVEVQGTLIGRMIFQKSAATAEVESVYATVFSTASANDHGNLVGLTDDDHAQYSLVDGSRAFTAPVTGVAPTVDLELATKKYVDDNAGAGDMLAANNLSDLASDDQAIENLIDGSTVETAILAADKLLMKDTSGSHGANLTYGVLFGEGKAIVIAYTGSGISGKTVALTGVNRASRIEVFDLGTGSVIPIDSTPNGATGAVRIRKTSNGSTATYFTLSTAAAGSSQVLTINTTALEVNSSGRSYVILVVGTPT